MTSAGHADSYVTATGAPGFGDPLVTELYLIGADAPGITVGGPFDSDEARDAWDRAAAARRRARRGGLRARTA